jgi:DNA-directed RNA polymerase subunit E'/Rpb7
MFYISSLIKEICINPKDFNYDIKITLTSEIKKLEGKIMGNVGYIVYIVEFNQLSDGKIDNETGKVLIKVNYIAVTFTLEKNELIYAIPFYINEHGFFCKINNCKIFTSKHMIDNYEHDAVNNMWFNKTDGTTVEIGKLIKLKIINVRINYDEIAAMGILV